MFSHLHWGKRFEEVPVLLYYWMKFVLFTHFREFLYTSPSFDRMVAYQCLLRMEVTDVCQLELLQLWLNLRFSFVRFSSMVNVLKHSCQKEVCMCPSLCRGEKARIGDEPEGYLLRKSIHLTGAGYILLSASAASLLTRMFGSNL